MESLDKLEEIRKLCEKLGKGSNYSQIIDNLPQVVVVGAQTAGKLSVIERITKVSVPIGTGTCTKIATRIISRESKHTKKIF